ncbi:hypothetical protein IQ220_04445 [Cyanobium sp. LEGE 06113]|nr:hypothetical protein [Cyanobium sp. LEGE 06113]
MIDKLAFDIIGGFNLDYIDGDHQYIEICRRLASHGFSLAVIPGFIHVLLSDRRIMSDVSGSELDALTRYNEYVCSRDAAVNLTNDREA